MIQKVNKNEEILFECPGCHHVQVETIMKGDNYAFVCDNCCGAVESDQLHLLQTIAEFAGGNSMGMGRYGLIFHKIKIDNRNKE